MTGVVSIWTRAPGREAISRVTPRRNVQAERWRPQGRGQCLEGGGNCPSILCEVADRQPGQIHVYRQPRHVVLEQIDCCTTLEGEASLGVEQRQDLHQQTDAIQVALIPGAHRAPPGG